MNLIGTQVGSYVVERELGSGGTGTVYLCRHTLIERNVAMKVLHDDHAMDPDAVARFFQEAKTAAEIGHPNIITIIDYGETMTPHGKRAYLMMEALVGQSLDKRIRAGGLSLSAITHVLLQCCSALVASHGKGIIHRDLKPANVFLCDLSFDPLFVKVLDFGTAKLTTPDPSKRRTQFGMVLGTPAYMSPEQCDGHGIIDHRSDVYSLGVMLFEMLTGTLPFGGDVREILTAQLHDTAPTPRSRNPEIPKEWEALCMRMMEKQKTARFQSMTEVAAALTDLGAHAAAYDSYVSAREATGHSGHTQRLTNVPGDQPTLDATFPPHLPGTSARKSGDGEPSPAAACATLFEPAHAAFLGRLLERLEGRWYDVVDVCREAAVAAAIPAATRVTWIEPPDRDPQRAAIVFVHVPSGWSQVVIAARPSAP